MDKDYSKCIIMVSKKTNKVFHCSSCLYTTTRKSSWEKHLQTLKHYYATLEDDNPPLYECSNCHKVYKYQSGLDKHKLKTCPTIVKSKKPPPEPQGLVLQNHQDLEKEVQDLKGVIKQFFVAQNKVMTQMEEQNKLINEMVPKIGNINNSFNINVFLNEKCKDAINMSDFIESLQIQVTDLLYTKDNGLLEGISSVLLNGLKQLDTYKRPIHCTDIKRETLYIKDNNAWDKDNGKEKIRSAMNDIAYKERKAINEWELANPGWDETEQGKQEYINIVRAVMSDINESVPKENKIIRTIAREMNINKDFSKKIKG